jgi:hypothetical protein
VIEDSVLKFRAFLLMLVFVHVLLHPWVHIMGSRTSSSQTTSASDAGRSSQSNAAVGDRCELCRVGHNGAITPRLPKAELLNPQWISLALWSINYSSLQADLRLPSRAPPIL